MNPNQQLILLHPPTQQQQPPRVPDSIVVPPRVNVAIAIINTLNAKLAPIVVTAEGGSTVEVQKFDGQVLTSDEQDLHKNACQMLQTYLDGNLEADQWEKPVRTRIEKRSERQASEQKKSVAWLMACPRCHGAGADGCEVCGGDGTVAMVRKAEL